MLANAGGVGGGAHVGRSEGVSTLNIDVSISLTQFAASTENWLLKHNLFCQTRKREK